MRHSESTILRRILLACSRGATRLFRNNVGQAAVDGRIIRYGVANPGGSDLIGWTSITIGPEHIGQQIAVFTAIEAKAAGGRPTGRQAAFLSAARQAGGIAAIAHSPEEALHAIASLRKA